MSRSEKEARVPCLGARHRFFLTASVKARFRYPVGRESVRNFVYYLLMARSVPPHLPKALFHLMARGRRGQDIFLRDSNRTEFLELFGELCGRKNWACYAYCLMNNHYHLVLETSDANVASGIRQLNSTYARRFNRGHGRQGHLFQGHLMINLVDNASYLRELIRYVVLNPVRANIVQDPEAWLWSSYPATIGAAPAPSWLARARLLSHFGPTLDQGIARVINFVRERQGAQSITSDLRARSVLVRRISRTKRGEFTAQSVEVSGSGVRASRTRTHPVRGSSR